MNKTELFAVSIKFLGFTLLVSWVTSIVRLTSLFLLVSKSGGSELNFLTPNPENDAMLQGAISCVYAILSYLFISYPEKIAQRLMKQSSAKVIEDKFSVIWLVVAFQGFSLITYSFITLFYHVFDMLRTATSFTEFLTETSTWLFPIQVAIVSYLAQLLIGVALLLKAKTVSQFLWKTILIKFWK